MPPMQHATASVILLCIGTCFPAHAVTINFEDQPLTVGLVEDTRTISTVAGDVTFFGGFFTSERTSPDPTIVYGTGGPSGTTTTPFSNPLIITFENPVTNFSVLALGEAPDFISPGTGFQLSDNAGHYTFGSTPRSGFTTLRLNVPSTVFTIFGSPTSSRAPAWDFAIDNVSFDPVSQTPLPAAFPLMATGVSMWGLFAWLGKRKSQRLRSAAP